MKKLLTALLLLCLLVLPAAGAETAGYTKLTNTQLGISLLYPSAWESNPGTATICFLENTGSATAYGRMAITVKNLKDNLNADQMEDQLTAYASVISTLYGSFTVTEMTTNSQFMNTRASSLLYSAENGGTRISGFVTMANINKKLYAFHYSCPADEFDARSEEIKALRNGVELLNK